MSDKDQMDRLKEAKAKYDERVAKVLQKMPERKADFANTSGIPVKRVYTPLDMEEFDYRSNWVCRASIPTPGRCSPPPIAAVFGPCGSMPVSPAPTRPTSATISF